MFLRALAFGRIAGRRLSASATLMLARVLVAHGRAGSLSRTGGQRRGLLGDSAEFRQHIGNLALNQIGLADDQRLGRAYVGGQIDPGPPTSSHVVGMTVDLIMSISES